MHMVNVAKRWVLGLCLCEILVPLAGCSVEGEKVVRMPAVTEESLTPEQKAMLEARRKQQAELMRRVGAPVPVDPQEFARKKMEEMKAQQDADKKPAAEDEKK